MIDKHPASFRDPSGFIFQKNGTILRLVTNDYRDDYRHLLDSGLYQKLTREKLLIEHIEINQITEYQNTYKVLMPSQLRFLTYPYEWCFSQLKSAALTMLTVQEKALENGMILKDGSSYNIQFLGSKPVFIDTLSFTLFKETPWAGYAQFCRHFVYPLFLMHYRDAIFGKLLISYLDGISEDVAFSLIPKRAYLNFDVFIHLGLQRLSKYFLKEKFKSKNNIINKCALLEMTHSLKKLILGLSPKNKSSQWSEYTKSLSYSKAAAKDKDNIVSQILKQSRPKTVLDIGANTGYYSRMAAKNGANVVALDSDHEAVDAHYRKLSKSQTLILPLWIDITNPSPSIGWFNQERDSFLSRRTYDLVLVLALIHHLAIGANIPLPKIALLLSKLSQEVVLEFIPKEDPQVKSLLIFRKDIFPDYMKEGFSKALGFYFDIRKIYRITDSDRLIFHLKRRL